MKKDAARDALVQEARELLVAMEAALLQIESDGPSRDSINAIFRAAHTIKGSAGLFAFDSIVAFTHLLESVLEKVRTGVLPLDDAMMSLLLNSGDYMSSLVDAIAELKEDQDPDVIRRAELEAMLNACLERVAAAPAPTAASTEAPTAASVPTPATPAVNHQRATILAPPDKATADVVANPNWHLSLRFSPDVLRDGLDPLSFLRYLLTMGRATYAHVIDNAIPGVDEMDPELCYLGFEIGFASTMEREAIESVFEFVREDSDIVVLPPHSPLADYRRWLARLAEREHVARLLLQSQALSDAEWRQLTEDDSPVTALVDAIDAVDAVEDAGSSDQSRPPAPSPSASVLSTPPRVKVADDKKVLEQKFIKIEVSKLDQLIDLVGELVIAGAGASLVAKRKKDQRFEEATQTISGLVEQIRDAALTLRMVQVNEVFQRFPRVVRDMSREMHKNIELIITGADTELDKSMVEKISDPLMHIVRNAMDHGIESSDLRRAAGKSEAGVLRLNATHESGSVVIEVFDDGRGLDKERILKKAVQQGLVPADAPLSEREIFRLIFEPGFSTAEQVTALSGRGVGMDVVKRNIESLQGEVEIYSSPGQGTMVRIRLPLTLAIIAGFQVVVGGAVFVIPLDLVVECINLSAHQVHNNIVTLRDEPLPFIPLRELFDLPHKESPRKSLVIVQYGQMRAGLLVDNLLGECQAVIKPLGKLFSKVKGLSGSTILGDGRVALILDVPHLIAHTGKLEQASVRRAEPKAESGEHMSNG